MLELEARIVMALERALHKHTEGSLKKPGSDPSLFDYGYAVGVADGLRQARQVVLSALSDDEDQEGPHGAHGRVRLPGRPL